MPATAVQSHSTTIGDAKPGSMPNQQQGTPLRRAVYVHVSDLTSAYNINHAKLEEELDRAKEEQENSPEDSSRLGGVPTELDTSAAQRRLQPPRAGYNLCVLVGKVNLVVDKKRVDGTRVRLAEVEVGDETGVVSLRARDEQIDLLTEVSERSGAAVLRNCTLELYQGKHIRLAVTKWGKISSYPDQIASTPPPPSKINRDRNFSRIDLSLVASEMVTFMQSDPYNVQNAQHSAQTTHDSENRPHQYPSNQSHGRGRGRRQRSAHGKQAPQVQGHYGHMGVSPSLTAFPPGGLHGYSGMQDLSYQYGAPAGRQAPGISSPQHQMMMQQQYEMQQRQMQHHHTMYQQDPMAPVPAGSPLLSQGIPPSFQPAPAPSSGGMQRQHRPASQSRSTEYPGKMNPQAATFDPTYHK